MCLSTLRTNSFQTSRTQWKSVCPSCVGCFRRYRLSKSSYIYITFTKNRDKSKTGIPGMIWFTGNLIVPKPARSNSHSWRQIVFFSFTPASLSLHQIRLCCCYRTKPVYWAKVALSVSSRHWKHESTPLIQRVNLWIARSVFRSI